MFRDEALQALDPTAPTGDFRVRLVEGVSTSTLIADLAAASEGRLVTRDLTGETDANFNDERKLVAPMTGLSIGLALLAAANLLSSLAFSVRERIPEIGTLKAIGFTPAQVTASVVAGVIPLAVVGTVVGAPLGWYMLDLIIRSQAEDHLPADIVRVPGPGWIAALILCAVAITLLGSFLPARRAGRLPSSEALRSE